jgi:hypothetical protein
VAERIFPVLESNPVDHIVRIVEHELDMKRAAAGPPIIATRLSRLLRWLMPPAGAVASPTRSVARELEEAYPSRDN